MLISGVEGDQRSIIDGGRQTDPELIIWCFEEEDLHPHQREALSEGVSKAAFLLIEDLRHDEKIIEEEDFALMKPRLVPLVEVVHLVQPTVANESAMWQAELRSLSYDSLLHFLNLSHVVGGRLEFG